MYQDVITNLRAAYDRHAGEREHADVERWKQDQREAFFVRLREAGAVYLLELGAGTGKDGLFFKENGLDVTCIDLSPEMVARCREKGLRALVRDVLHLGFGPGSFDAAYALNSLLHVPRRDLPTAFERIRNVLRPGGLFYLGLYGGIASEGVWADDRYEPKRFFCLHTDDGIRAAVEPYFRVLSFDRIQLDRSTGLHFQALVLLR